MRFVPLSGRLICATICCALLPLLFFRGVTSNLRNIEGARQKEEREYLRLHDRAWACLHSCKLPQAVSAADAAKKYACEHFGTTHWRSFNDDYVMTIAKAADGLEGTQRERTLDAFQKERESLGLEAAAQFESAVERLESTIPAYADSFGANSLICGQAWHNIGRLKAQLGKIEEALDASENAEQVFLQKLPHDHPHLGLVACNIGICYFLLGKTGESEIHFSKALEILSHADGVSNEVVASVLTELGNVRLRTRKFDQAQEFFGRAIKLLRLRPFHNKKAIALNTVGIAQARQGLGDFKEGVSCCNQAVDDLSNSVDSEGCLLANAFDALGACWLGLRDLQQSKKYFTEAIRLRKQDMNLAQSFKQHALANSLSCLSSAHCLLRELDEAARALQESDSIYLGLPSDYLSSIEADLAVHEIHHALLHKFYRDYKSALQHYNLALAYQMRALPEKHPDLASTYNNIGLSTQELGNYEEAEIKFEAAMNIWAEVYPQSHPEIILCKTNIATNDILGNRISARTVVYVEEAIAESKNRLQWLLGSQAESDQLLSSAVARYAVSLRFSAFLREKENAALMYDTVAGIKGIVTASQKKRRQMLESNDPFIVSLVADLNRIHEKLLAVASWMPSTVDRSKVESLIEQSRDLERRIATRSSGIDKSHKRVSVTGHEIHESLAKDVCLLDFIEYFEIRRFVSTDEIGQKERRLAVFVVPGGGRPITFIDLGPTQQLEELVSKWRDHVRGSDSRAHGNDIGIAMRKLLWEPIEHFVGNAQVVIVSPDGPLNFVNFAAIPGKQHPFLIFEHAFVSTPAPLLLPEMMGNTRRANHTDMLLFGNIEFGIPHPVESQFSSVPLDWLRLPGTQKELEKLLSEFKNRFPNAVPTVFSRAAATKEAFLDNASKHSVIHVATHGFFIDDKEAPLVDFAEEKRQQAHFEARKTAIFSGIVFAGINTSGKDALQKHILTSLDISAMHFPKVDLIFLNACNSADGRSALGEGTIGLQRSFQIAGARSILGSLWAVDDEMAQKFMAKFYERYWQGVGKARALQEAQIWLIENASGSADDARTSGPKTKSYYSWAAFTLAGDWR